MWVNLGYWDDGRSRNSSFAPYLNFRLSTSFVIGLGANLYRADDHTQWLGNFTDGGGVTHYAFAHLDQRTVSMNVRIRYTLSPDLTFELYDVAASTTTVAAADVHLGLSLAVAQFSGGGAAPSYNGDDRAIVFSAPDNTVPTGGNLWRSALAADHLTPAGDPQLYLAVGVFGTVYRRGSFQPGRGKWQV